LPLFTKQIVLYYAAIYFDCTIIECTNI